MFYSFGDAMSLRIIPLVLAFALFSGCVSAPPVEREELAIFEAVLRFHYAEAFEKAEFCARLSVDGKPAPAALLRRVNQGAPRRFAAENNVRAAKRTGVWRVFGLSTSIEKNPANPEECYVYADEGAHIPFLFYRFTVRVVNGVPEVLRGEKVVF